MGLGERFLERLVRESSFGLSDKIGITGVDGFVHDNSKAVAINDDGICFEESQFKIGKSDIISITKEEGNSSILGDNTLYGFNFRGGLVAYIRKCDINSDADWLDMSFCGIFAQTLDKKFQGECTYTPIAELDISDLSSANASKLSRAISDVLWAADVADKIRGIDGISLNEIYLLLNYFQVYKTLWNVSDAYFHAAETEKEPDKALDKFPEISQTMPTFIRLIKRQLKYVDPDFVDKNEGVRELIADIFADSRGGDPINEYDNLRNARAHGKKYIDDKILETLTSFNGGCLPLGDLAWADKRKMIVCTDAEAALTTWGDGLQIPNDMVMDAQDIIAYNKAVEKGKRLIFELGHPLNGVMYVQHPLQKNVYIDTESFHGNMLERKYAELIRLLVALGATEITCEVENNSSSDEKQRHKKSGRAGIDTLAGGGEVDFNSSVASLRTIALSKKLATSLSFKSGGKPHVPKDMIFFPFEDSWQHLAEMAMEGRIGECDVCLTYSKDYAVTGQKLASVGARVRSKVPGYQFGVEGNFSADFDNELKQLQSTVWHYHAKFGSGLVGVVNGLSLATNSDAVSHCGKTGGSSSNPLEKWETALSIGEKLINIAKRTQEG